MKILTIIFGIFFLIGSTFTLPIYSQSAEEVLESEELESDLGQTIIVGDNAFSVVLTREVQNPADKKITYRFRVLPNITTDRVEIEWYVSGGSEAVTEQKKVLSVTQGEEFSEYFTIRPRNEGVFAKTEVRVEIRSFRASGNNIAAARDQFIANEEREIIPITPQYQRAKTLNTIKDYGLMVAFVIVVIVVGQFAYKRFRKWLEDGKVGMRED